MVTRTAEDYARQRALNEWVKYPAEVRQKLMDKDFKLASSTDATQLLNPLDGQPYLTYPAGVLNPNTALKQRLYPIDNSVLLRTISVQIREKPLPEKYPISEIRDTEFLDKRTKNYSEENLSKTERPKEIYYTIKTPFEDKLSPRDPTEKTLGETFHIGGLFGVTEEQRKRNAPRTSGFTDFYMALAEMEVRDGNMVEEDFRAMNARRKKWAENMVDANVPVASVNTINGFETALKAVEEQEDRISIQPYDFRGLDKNIKWAGFS